MTTQNQTPKVDYGKSTLFRFLHIANPKLVTTSNTAYSIIKPKVNTSNTSANARLIEIVPMTSLSEIKALNPNLYLFGEWLAENKRAISLSTVKSKIEGVSNLLSENEQTLWDNLFYQLTKGNSSSISEKLVNLVRANAFVEAFSLLSTEELQADSFSEANQEKFSSISNAMISIPKDILTTEQTNQVNSGSLLTTEQQKVLKRRQKAAIAKYRMEYFEKIKQQFEKVEAVYSKEVQAAYEQALIAHQAAVDDILAENPPETTLVEEQLVTSYPDLPKFTYTSSLIFNLAYIVNNGCFTELANNIQALVSAGLLCGDISKVTTICNEQIKSATEDYLDNIALPKEKEIDLYGISIKSDNSPLHNSYIVQLVKLLPTDTAYSVVYTHFSKNGANKVSKVNATVTLGDNTLVPQGKQTTMLSNDEFSSFLMFNNEIEISESDSVILTGSVYSEEGENLQPFELQLADSKLVYGPQYNYTVGDSNSRIAGDSDGMPGNESMPLYGIKKIGIGEYMKVEQEVCCYVPGEVSHIENIMKSEHKNKIDRVLTREETSTEESSETENESTSDRSTTDRYEMHKEIQQMIAKENSSQIGITAGANVQYKPSDMFNATVNASTNLNFSNSSSSSSNFNTSESFAKEVTEKATDRILKKVGYKRIAKMLREHEETNEHGFDNRKGSGHVVGIYRWIDKIYKNTLLNYGKRLMYDFMIPEPARNFKQWMTEKATTDNLKPIAPVYPGSAISISSGFVFTDIDASNYTKIAAQYGLNDLPACPDNELVINKSFTESTLETDRSKMPYLKINGAIEIPTGYVSDKMKFTTTYKGFNGKEGAYDRIGNRKSWVNVGGVFIYGGDAAENTLYFTSNNGSLIFNSIDAIEKELAVSIICNDISVTNIDIVLKCKRKVEAYAKWQNNIYMRIMEAYQKKMNDYQDQLKSYYSAISSINQAIDYSYNPGKGRAIEQRELKRACVELMMRPSPHTAWYSTGRNNFSWVSPYGNGQMIDISPTFDLHARYVSFVEQAFEWNIMSYEFMPYFYGADNEWKNLIKEKSTADPLFEAFLQSGMARVTLTVRPGFEKHVLYFLDTGMVPVGDSFVPGGAEDWYQSIAELLVVKPEDTQLKDEENPPYTWETRVPTDLVILQSDAAPLMQKGLPCKCTEGEAQEGLGMGESSLGIMNTDTGVIIQQIQTALTSLITTVASLTQGNNNEQQGNPAQSADQCIEYKNQFSTEQSNVSNYLNQYNNATDKSVVYNDVLAGLNTSLNSMNTILADAAKQGCDTNWMSSAVTQLLNDIQ